MTPPVDQGFSTNQKVHLMKHKTLINRYSAGVFFFTYHYWDSEYIVCFSPLPPVVLYVGARLHPSPDGGWVAGDQQGQARVCDESARVPL